MRKRVGTARMAFFNFLAFHGLQQLLDNPPSLTPDKLIGFGAVIVLAALVAVLFAE